MSEIQLAKQKARKLATATRDKAKKRDTASEAIQQLLLELPQIQQASCVCCYVSFRSEVETHPLIAALIELGKTVCVPWCDDDELRLCKIESLDELAPGTFGLLEPTKKLRNDDSKQLELSRCQVILIPGLAFTLDGNRLGYGKGYYDRLLSKSPTAWRIGLAFDCQIIPAIPTTDQDVEMDFIVTESKVHSTTAE